MAIQEKGREEKGREEKGREESDEGIENRNWGG